MGVKLIGRDRSYGDDRLFISEPRTGSGFLWRIRGPETNNMCLVSEIKSGEEDQVIN